MRFCDSELMIPTPPLPVAQFQVCAPEMMFAAPDMAIPTRAEKTMTLEM